MTESILSFFKSTKPAENNILNFMDEDPEANDQTSMITSVKNNIKNSIEVEKNYTSFFIIFAVGLIFLMISFIFLPMIILFPQKFVSLFSIGSIIILFSFVFVYGTINYIGMLFEGKRSIYTFIYLASISFGFYFSFFNSNYLFCLISAVIQVIMLMIFVLSFIPGGESGISFIIEGIKLIFIGMWRKVFTKK